MNWGINPWNYTLAEYGTHTYLFVFEYFLGEREEKEKVLSTTYSYPSTPATEASFSIAKSLASARSPFPFRSNFQSGVSPPMAA